MIPVVAGSNPVSYPIFQLFCPAPRLKEAVLVEDHPVLSMESLESRIGYKFRNSLLLAESLTHPSLAYESQKPHFDNQRLEFLGDSVIQLVLTEALFQRFPQFPEGRLTKLRARMVSKKGLTGLAQSIELGTYVMLGKGEEASGGRERASTLADAFEAVIGAIYLDGSLDAARKVLMELTKAPLAAIAEEPEEKNPKGELQETLQSISPESPVYELKSESGPDHDKQFECEVTWNGRSLARGRGSSKKAAEISAARAALESQVWLTKEK